VLYAGVPLSHNIGSNHGGRTAPQGWSYMPNILSSWKEIGQYLGKGVRTVQRWEKEADLPVRRQARSSRHAVIALPADLDAWARSRTRGPSGALAGALQREIAVLHAENVELRAGLEVLESTVLAMSVEASSVSNAHQLGAESKTFAQCARREIPATVLPGIPGYARSEIQAIRLAAQQCRAEALRARLSLASTLCAVGESRDGGAAIGALRRAQHSMLEIRRSLEIPGYVPTDQLDELRGLLRDLASRVDLLAQAPARNPHAAVTCSPLDAEFVN